MIRLDMVQGSPEWQEARLGIPTASAFHRIMTPATRKWSSQVDAYMAELVVEWMTGLPAGDDLDTPWMQRGRALEDRAVGWYEFEHDATVDRIGFAFNDAETAGCSPDGLVGPDGGLEVKCRGATEHVRYLLGSDQIAAMTQVQGGMWICGREWWDVLANNPDLPQRLVRVYRDDAYIRDLAGYVDRFVADLIEAREKITRARESGLVRSEIRALAEKGA